MNAVELLAAARVILEDPRLASVSGWPRAVALLTRQALESAIEEFWSASAATAGLADCIRKAQLTCLPAYLEPGVSGEIGYVWAALSNACHYHPFDLAPTAGELGGWIEAVGALLESMGGKAPA